MQTTNADRQLRFSAGFARSRAKIVELPAGEVIDLIDEEFILEPAFSLAHWQGVTFVLSAPLCGMLAKLTENAAKPVRTDILIAAGRHGLRCQVEPQQVGAHLRAFVQRTGAECGLAIPIRTLRGFGYMLRIDPTWARVLA